MSAVGGHRSKNTTFRWLCQRWPLSYREDELWRQEDTSGSARKRFVTSVRKAGLQPVLYEWRNGKQRKQLVATQRIP
jgi:hypothetical protein